MRDGQPGTVYLHQYRVPDFLIDSTALEFDLGDDCTLVRSRLGMRRNPEAGGGSVPLVLHGQALELLSIQLDDVPLPESAYRVDDESLTLYQVPESFVLECVTRIYPHNNASLEGLYQSRGMFCTQCEAEGFRKITYYLDRPDVMSVFTTTLVGDAARYPVLLSNGNLVEQEPLPDGRHRAVWHDPFRKPAYLFALVAGDLQHIEDHFVTASGRRVTLRIYVEPKDLDKCDHAMDSLKRSMRWDEQVYGREYDLDIFMIVAVDDFNMGAMENKGLNIFNTSCILAHPETTTDAGFQRVEAVVAHEYFHNWSGNRVTCRDWFQLSLKEGFTVFRDAEFSADMGSRTVKRVEDAVLLRTQQFAEDAGPMAHPVRPDSYMEISNFYTLTVYEKGAEVVRMLHTLLGPVLFRQGCDLYFARHDGQAVTCDDFVRAMEDVSGRDLSQFRRWYTQAGTPRLEVTGEYLPESSRYRLTVRQSCPATPGQPEKQPMHIPLAMGLVGARGDLPLQLEGEAGGTPGTRVLELTDAEHQFVFTGVSERPVLSLPRGFSAPVKVQANLARDDLMFLMQADSDGFSRWDACQQLATQVLQEGVAALLAGRAFEADPRLVRAFGSLLDDDRLDSAMVAHMLVLPSEAYLSEISEVIEVEAIHRARESLKRQLAAALAPRLWARYRTLSADAGPYRADAAGIARRSLRNAALAYLMLTGTEEALAACERQFHEAGNMTDRLAALTALVNAEQAAAVPLRERALEAFYQRWSHEPLVVNLWFSVQAASTLPGTLERVRALMAHPAFDARNPNKLRAVIGTFCQQNAVNFHAGDGEGYDFLAGQVLTLDQSNPQIAARLLTPLTRWSRYPAARASRMCEALSRIARAEGLSPDVHEVVTKSLPNA